MSDEFEDIEEYNPQTYMDGLRAKGALRECPCCGDDSKWYSPEDGLVRIPGTVSEQGIAHRVNMSMECAPVVCGNCNFVRFHLLSLPLG
ncbi:MAG: hypothetical protein WKF96_15330 [Solirubrobacteraceae bacterium]